MVFGISEEIDVVVLVVFEESGWILLVVNGIFDEGFDVDELCSVFYCYFVMEIEDLVEVVEIVEVGGWM